MARRNEPQQMSRDNALRVALKMDSEADLFIPEEEAGLTAQQWRAVALLAGGTRQIDVAAQLDIRQETVSRWKQDVRFVAALNWAIKEHYTVIENNVREAAAEAVTVLRETMKSDDPRLRLSAALNVLRLHSDHTIGTVTLPTTPADVAREEMHEREAKARRDLFI